MLEPLSVLGPTHHLKLTVDLQISLTSFYTLFRSNQKDGRLTGSTPDSSGKGL